MIDFGLAGSVIVVTGAASGIGRAIAQAAAVQGAAVAVLDRNLDAARAAAQQLSPTSCAYVLDVRDPDATDEVFDSVEAQMGPITGVVACAGLSQPAPAEEMAPANWANVLDVNLTGTFLTLQAAGRRMLPRGKGAMVAVGSVDSLGGHHGRAHYVSTKFGVTGIVKTLAIEWGWAWCPSEWDRARPGGHSAVAPQYLRRRHSRHNAQPDTPGEVVHRERSGECRPISPV